MAKSNFKNISNDVISVTSSLLRHQKRHKTNGTGFFYFGPLPIKISGYASALLSHLQLYGFNIIRTSRTRACKFLCITQRFFWQMSPSFHVFANNSKRLDVESC